MDITTSVSIQNLFRQSMKATLFPCVISQEQHLSKSFVKSSVINYSDVDTISIHQNSDYFINELAYKWT